MFNKKTSVKLAPVLLVIAIFFAACASVPKSGKMDMKDGMKSEMMKDDMMKSDMKDEMKSDMMKDDMMKSDMKDEMKSDTMKDDMMKSDMKDKK